MKNPLKKTPTGIDGLDQITNGGLPRRRATLICGGAGCGKTLLASEFVIKGITDFDEPGAFITFEETAEELTENVASLGYDLESMIENKSLFIHEISLGPEELVELGRYNLDGLFVRIEYAIDSVGAQRVVIDGIESLFSSFSREQNLRAEIKRLFQWLKKKGVTPIITAERDDESKKLTKHGIEEFLSDCVIFLDQRIQGQVAVRRLHIIKYRGARHGTNEYPFLVTENGISVLPITALELDHEVPRERVSTGVAQLDEMFDGKGYYRGSSILVSGTSGTGKSSLAGCFAKSICQKGGRCIYFAFEESPSQIIRNMRSIGIDLLAFKKQGLLYFHAARPTIYGLEMHLLTMHRIINEFTPEGVILDPISNLTSIGASLEDIKLMFLRILDHLKQNKITALCTNLTTGGLDPEATEVGVSSIMDTWILLENIKKEDQRKRSISIIKSRGMPHSKSVRGFELTDNGIVIDQ